jgi:hypothetical protein
LAGILGSTADELPLNLNRDQFSYSSHGLSRKRVEAVRDLLEEACHRHWAYQVTSTIPWWINRGHYSYDDLRTMSRELAEARNPRQSVPESHMKRALTKANSAVREELGLKVRFRSSEDVAATSRALLAENR